MGLGVCWCMSPCVCVCDLCIGVCKYVRNVGVAKRVSALLLRSRVLFYGLPEHRPETESTDRHKREGGW